MCEKGIAEKLPENCPVSIVLEEGTTDLHRRVLLDDLEECEYFLRSFLDEYGLEADKRDVWSCVYKKVETMTMNEIRRFAGY